MHSLTIYMDCYIFNGFSWELAHKLQTITYYLGMPVILLFCYYFFSGWLNDHPSDTIRLLIRTGNLSSIGQLVFVLTFALIMARRISDSFTIEKKMMAR